MLKMDVPSRRPPILKRGRSPVFIEMHTGLPLDTLLSSRWEFFAAGHCNMESAIGTLKNRMASLTAVFELTPLLLFEYRDNLFAADRLVH